MRTKTLFILALTTFAQLLTLPVHAKDILKTDAKYRIVDVDKKGEMTLIKEYNDYQDAYQNYQNLLDQHDNLCLAKGEDFIEAETALVSFHRSQACDVNVEYNDVYGNGGYTNGCYAGDGAYLENDSMVVSFQLSGIQAQANLDEVDIIPFHPNKVSYYMVHQGRLYHYIKTNVEAPGHGNVLSLGIAPEGLQADLPYYSYDGHYFYTDYALMIQDYRNDKITQAVNVDQPYYNYYQYLSHRSSSNYTYEDFIQMLPTTFGIKETMSSFIHDGSYNHMDLSQSLIVQGGHAFFQYQNQFGANAMMMLSLAMNESSYGRSALAFSRNNLFGHAAYDSDVDGNASGYEKVSDSIYYHAHDYISLSYLNPQSFTFHGGHLGNKAGGINVSYASDPYWGEKAAQFYLNLDEAFGSKDYQAYRIGVSKSKAVALKKEANSQSETIYQIPQGQETAYIINKEVETADGLWYEVNHEEAKNDGTYNPQTHIAYVKASQLDYVSNNKVENKTYLPIHFDANGGTYYPHSSKITQYVEANKTPAYCYPEKEGYYFLNYQSELAPATQETTYVAQYEKIDNLEILGEIQNVYAKGEYLNINGAKLKITCGKNIYEIPLTTDYISNFTSRSLGKKQMVINYAGIKLNVNYEITEAKNTPNAKLQQKAAQIIANYEKQGTLSNEDITSFNELLAQLKTHQQALDIATIRYLDRILEPYNVPRLSVILNDDKYDLQASGLAFQEVPTSFLTQYVPVTLQIDLKPIKHKLQEQIQNTFQNNYYQLEDVFNITMKADFTTIHANNDMVYSLRKPQDSANKLYRVFAIHEDGSVKQLPSEQSKERITFQANGESFALVSITQAGILDTFDFTEVYHQNRNMRNYISFIQTIGIGAGIALVLVIGLIVFLIIKRKKAK